MNIIFFEDPEFANFCPLSLSHPVYTLLCGTSKIYEKWVKVLKPRSYSFLTRPYLSALLARETGRTANTIPTGDIIFINGRFAPAGNSLAAIRKLNPGEAAVSEGVLLAFRLAVRGKISFKNALLSLYEDESYKRIRSLFKTKNVDGKVFSHLWDLVDGNAELIAAEFPEIIRTMTASGKVDPGAVLIKKGSIAVFPGAVVGSQVTIDATEGPVILDSGVIVDPLTYIKGPAYIGRGCRLVGGKIREGCSFGPTCRVGGEVEESIMLGYDNKYHEGFLGHSYLGEWVNLGAMTTNSDLKNNYGKIEVMLHDKPTDTGRLKVGCFIGDHTKTGIGTLLNTGITIGFSCNLYGGSLFAEKSIKSFSWGTPGNLVEYRVDKAMETALSSMKRRNIMFDNEHQELFEVLHRSSGWRQVKRKAGNRGSRS